MTQWHCAARIVQLEINLKLELELELEKLLIWPGREPSLIVLVGQSMSEALNSETKISKFGSKRLYSKAPPAPPP